MNVCVLGSGSRGNCIAVWDYQEGILIDAGLSYRQTQLRAKTRGIDLRYFRYCLLTHAHGDHHNSVRAVVEKHDMQIYTTRKTVERMARIESFRNGEFLQNHPGAWTEIHPPKAFAVGPWAVKPLWTDHATEGAVTFVIVHRPTRVKLALFIETGKVDDLMWQAAKGAEGWIVEANYDVDMLAQNDTRPDRINERTAHTHLSNHQARDILSKVGNRAQHAILVHLSQDNNFERLVANTVPPPGLKTTISNQDEPTPVISLEKELQ